MKTIGQVASLLGDILSGDAREMGASFRLTPDNGVAPIDVAKLAIACEEAFGLSLYDEKIARWETLRDAAAHIDTLLEEGMAEPTERTDDDRLGWYYE